VCAAAVVTREGAIHRIAVELRAERPERRRAALFALARAKAVEAAADVARLAGDPDPNVRLALLQSADALLPDPEPLARYFASDSDPAVRDSAQIRLLRS
jgi:HEAT repeat protein